MKEMNEVLPYVIPWISTCFEINREGIGTNWVSRAPTHLLL